MGPNLFCEKSEITYVLLNIGLFKVNLEWPFSGLKFENLENEISGRVRNWELETRNPGLKTLILGC
jgi:hypothetical protein